MVASECFRGKLTSCYMYTFHSHIFLCSLSIWMPDLIYLHPQIKQTEWHKPWFINRKPQNVKAMTKDCLKYTEEAIKTVSKSPVELFKTQKLSSQYRSSRSMSPSTEISLPKGLKSHFLIHVFYNPVSKVGNLRHSHVNLVAVPSLIAKIFQSKKLPECARSFLLILTRRDITCRWGQNWHSRESRRQTGAKPFKSRWLANGARHIVTNCHVLFSPLSNFPFALRNLAYFNTFSAAGGRAAAQVAVTERWNPPHAVRLPRRSLSRCPFGQTHWQHTLAYLDLVSQL